MTNRERINSLDDVEFMREIERIKNLKGFRYIDWGKWLRSEEEEYPYIGTPAIFEPYGEKKPCKILEQNPLRKSVVALIDNLVIELPKYRFKFFEKN